MPSIHPQPIYSRAETGILPCSKCGKPMRLTCIEPATPGYDVRTFECLECNTIRSFSVRV
jgi:ribosomal protein L37AE/L43A